MPQEDSKNKDSKNQSNNQKKTSDKKSRSDYTSKMWGQINQSNASKRRRPRRSANSKNRQEPQKNAKNGESKVNNPDVKKPVNQNKAEQKQQSHQKSDVKPINPFQSSNQQSKPAAQNGTRQQEQKPAQQSKPAAQNGARQQEQKPAQQSKPAAQSGARQQEQKPAQQSNNQPSTVPVNPFVTGGQQAGKVDKQDLEPADEGDQNLRNELDKKQLKEEEIPPNPFTSAMNQKSSKENSAQSHKQPEVEVIAPGEKVEKSESKGPDIPKSSEPRQAKSDEDKLMGDYVDSPEMQKTQSEDGLDVVNYQESFWDVLASAGITPKRLIIVGVLFVLLLLVAFYFMFASGDQGFDDSKESVSRNYPVVSSDSALSSDSVVSSDAYSLVSSYVFGLENQPQDLITAVPMGKYGSDSGVLASLILGGALQLQQAKLVSYMELLREMENIYNTNIYALLDRSVDRRKALNEHIADLDDVIERGLESYEQIEQKLANWNNDFDIRVQQRDTYEEAFFANLNELRGGSTYSSLNAFVEQSQAAIELQAYFNAYGTIRDMYVNSLNALRPRREDIFVNREALIKGVQVFDIPKSDIDAIIRFEE